MCACPFHYRRQPGSLPSTIRTSGRSARWLAQRPATSSELAAGEGSTTAASELPHPGHRSPTERDKQLLAELRRASEMALPPCILSLCHGVGRKLQRSHQRSPVLGCAWPLPLPLALGRGPLMHRQKDFDCGRRSRSVSLFPRYWGSNSGPLRRRKRATQTQTDEQRGKRTCALTAQGSISKATKGWVGGAAQGSADCRRNWTTDLIPRSSGTGNHPSSAECAEAARIAWSGERCKSARSAIRE